VYQRTLEHLLSQSPLNDADALIALKPDCIVYAASGPERDALAIPDYVRLLSAGINVVTTSTTRLVNPHSYEPVEWRDQLTAAAKVGQVSLYASGIEPGFAADYLPLVLTTQSASIEKIHSYEIGLYDDYGVPDIMINGMGFGQPLDYEPWVSIPGAIAGEWQGQIRLIADALGLEVQEVREKFDRTVTSRPSRSRWAPSRPEPAARCGCRRSASSMHARPLSSNTSRGSRPMSPPTGRRGRAICHTAW